MTDKLKLELERSKVRKRLGELAAKAEALTDGERAEVETLQTRSLDLETKWQAILLAEPEQDRQDPDPDPAVDAETRERLQLRSRCRLSNYLQANIRNRPVDGPEAELATELGLGSGQIPTEIFERTEQGTQERALTEAPTTVGVNLAPVFPAVFAQALMPRLGVNMPMVPSGTYATARISTSQSAAAKAKSSAAMATAGSFAVATTTPKRVSARLEIALEDVATIGAENFEAILRDNLSLALSDQLDTYGLRGQRPANPTGDDAAIPEGLLTALGNAPTGTTDVAGFDDFLTAYAGAIDGLWASRLQEVRAVVGPETYRRAAVAFRDGVAPAAYLGSISADSYMGEHTGGLFTSKRIADPVSGVQQGLMFRSGRTFLGGAMSGITVAIQPVWNYMLVDDIYSGSAKGERYVTVHALVGDVVVVQPDAYKRVAFRVST